MRKDILVIGLKARDSQCNCSVLLKCLMVSRQRPQSVMSDDEKLQLKYLQKRKQQEVKEKYQGVQKDVEFELTENKNDRLKKETKRSDALKSEQREKPEQSDSSISSQSKECEKLHEELPLRKENRSPDERKNDLPTGLNLVIPDPAKVDIQKREGEQLSKDVDEPARKKLVKKEFKSEERSEEKPQSETPKIELLLQERLQEKVRQPALESKIELHTEPLKEYLLEISLVSEMEFTHSYKETALDLLRELNPVEVYINARYDQELVRRMEAEAHIKPYEAVRNEVVEQPQLEHAVKKEARVVVAPRDLEKEERTRTNHRGVSGIYCDNERFVAVLPVPIAEKLAEFQQIEPETIEFLYEKYAHLQEYLPQSELDRVAGESSVNTLKEAWTHSTEQMKPNRKDPAREKRAEEQIVIVQHEIIETQCTPRYMDYMIITYDCNCRDGYYVFWSSELVGWEKEWHIVQPRIEKRVPKELDHDRDDVDRHDPER